MELYEDLATTRIRRGGRGLHRHDPRRGPVFELGSGGNASHTKRAFELTFVEPSDGMREVSRALDPECEHVSGDMRAVRLGRVFDEVFVHDAVEYMITEQDLRAALETVAAHLAPGETSYEAQYAFLLYEPDGTVRTVHDVHRCGVFRRATWLRLLREAGFAGTLAPRTIEGHEYDPFVAVKGPAWS